jgi:hypothetical protein
VYLLMDSVFKIDISKLWIVEGGQIPSIYLWSALLWLRKMTRYIGNDTLALTGGQHCKCSMVELTKYMSNDTKRSQVDRYCVSKRWTAL